MTKFIKFDPNGSMEVHYDPWISNETFTISYHDLSINHIRGMYICDRVNGVISMVIVHDDDMCDEVYEVLYDINGKSAKENFQVNFETVSIQFGFENN